MTWHAPPQGLSNVNLRIFPVVSTATESPPLPFQEASSQLLTTAHRSLAWRSASNLHICITDDIKGAQHKHPIGYVTGRVGFHACTHLSVVWIVSMMVMLSASCAEFDNCKNSNRKRLLMIAGIWKIQIRNKLLVLCARPKQKPSQHSRGTLP